MGSGGCLKHLSKRHLFRFSPEKQSLSAVVAESPFRSIHQQQCRSWARHFHHKNRPITPKISNPFLQISVPCRAFSVSAPSSSPAKTGLLGWYLGMLQSRPVLTKALSTSLIFAASDLTSQMITMPPSSFDKIRTLRMASYGLLILGPCQHVWFNFVSNAVPKRDVLSTVKKILMGQALFGPVINTVFFSYNAALQGENGDEIVARLKRDLPRTLLSGVAYWPGCDFVMFRYVPVHLHPLVNSSCSYIWTIYLTYMANLKGVGGDEGKDD